MAGTSSSFLAKITSATIVVAAEDGAQPHFYAYNTDYDSICDTVLPGCLHLRNLQLILVWPWDRWAPEEIDGRTRRIVDRALENASLKYIALRVVDDVGGLRSANGDALAGVWLKELNVQNCVLDARPNFGIMVNGKVYNDDAGRWM